MRARFISFAAVTAFIAVGPVTAKTAPTAKAPGLTADGSQALARAVLLNSEGNYPSLYEACEHSDFRALATALHVVRRQIAPDKSEYWTDAELAAFKDRAENTVNARGRLVVCQHVKDNKWAPFSYDANREIFVGEFRTEQTVTKFAKRIGRYTGRTAYGATATVNQVQGAEFDITMKFDATDAECRSHDAPPGCQIVEVGKPAGCPRTDPGTFRYEVPVPRSEAEALKADGYLVFVGKLKYPFVTWGYSPTFASIDQPLDMRIDIFDVSLAPDEVALVGPRGIVWKCNLAS
jgi:hypothetical protein